MNQITKPGTTAARLRELTEGWGPLPSIAPFSDDCPKLTTGHAVYLATKAADELDQLRADLRDIMRLSTEPGGEAQKLNEIHRRACAALQGGR